VWKFVLLMFLVVSVVGASAYEGILPEPYPTPNYGTANNICPARPTLWVTAYLYVGKARVGIVDGPRFIAQCVYCETSDGCSEKMLPFYSLETNRRWSWSAGGPCPPGQSADVNSTILHSRDDNGINSFVVANTGGGCNEGPQM